jgi:hypothetical protein
MKLFKILLISSIFFLFSNLSYGKEKTDCSKIETNTGSGWLKKALCKKGSDKLDSDGNFKKGTFNILKKFKKN